MEVLERGDVSFFFRPTVQPEDALEAQLGVQSFFLVLSPAHGMHRRVRVGRKRLPSRPGQRFWARVERTGTLQRVLADQVEAERYQTKTRGERYQPAARPIGQGSYAFVRHADHCHFVYRLDHVEPDVPREVHVDELGDFVVLFEHDEVTSARWTADGHPAQLDEERAELVFVAHGEVIEEQTVAGWVEPPDPRYS